MKNLIIIILTVISMTGFSQKSKYETSQIKVYGNCEMCQERIENALDVVGIRKATWNIETKMLEITYLSNKISLEEIHQICADIGHSTEKAPVKKEVYKNLHHCCKYDVPDSLKIP